jgi:putative membrane protein
MIRLRFYPLLSLLLPSVAWANGDDSCHGEGWGHMMDVGYGGMFMWLILLVLIGVVVYFVFQSSKSKSSATERPLDVLKKRYARGEITKEQFDQMKKDLSEP